MLNIGRRTPCTMLTTYLYSYTNVINFFTHEIVFSINWINIYDEIKNKIFPLSTFIEQTS